MARRFSGRELRERLALEAELTAKEKAEKQQLREQKPRSSKSPAAASPTGRSKMVWQVVDPGLREVATFPFPQGDEARAKAAELTARLGREHKVRSVKVPY